MRHCLFCFALLAAACEGSVDPDAGAGDAAPIVLSDAGAPAAVCPEGEPLSDLAGKPVFGLTIDGVPYRFVWDTGAPTSVVDDSIVAQLGEGPHAVVISGHEVSVSRFDSIDLARFGVDGVDGIVGTDVLGELVVTLDASRRRFWVDAEMDEAALAACAHAAGLGREIEFVYANYLYVPGRLEDAEGWFLVDTGASLGATPDAVFDELTAARPRAALGGFYTMAAIGTFWARLSTVERYEVGGLAVEQIALRTIPEGLIPPAPEGRFLGVLPSIFLSHFLFTVDYPRGVIRLDPFADDPLREPPRFYATGIGLAESVDPPVLVAQVLAGSAAEEQGVRVGDEVVSVRGLSIEDLTPSQRPWAFVSQAPNDQVDVVVRQGTEERALVLEARDLL